MLIIIFGIGLLLSLSSPAQAGWGILPESRYQLYENWGLFFDQQSTIVHIGRTRFWGSLGGVIPLAGDNDSPHHPQFIASATANAGIHYTDNWRLYTETFDARVGFAFQWEYNSNLRFSIGYLHFSGHTVDGIFPHDEVLVPLTLGQEFVPIRAVYDYKNILRFGFTINPVVRTYPDIEPVWLDQSIEYFPFGGADKNTTPSPYIALGLSEMGATKYLLTYNIQAGIYFGNHFSGDHHQTMRMVIGFYNGADPRLKQFEFRDSEKSYGYLGVMLDF